MLGKRVLNFLRVLRATPGALWAALAGALGLFLLISRNRVTAAKEATIDARALAEKKTVKYLVSQARKAADAALAAETRLDAISEAQEQGEVSLTEIHAAAKDAEIATREAQHRGSELRQSLFRTLDIKPKK